MAIPELDQLRLVGGTALALQFGHRKSIDLDLFGTLTCDNEQLFELLSKVGNAVAEKESPNIKIYEINGVKVDFVNYRYPWLDACIVEDGIRLASAKDIAAMKINAISGRGARKDFIDIYFLLQHFSLQDILAFYMRKYENHSVFRALMSLNYFVDAEKQLMPKMLIPVDWEEMKEYIREVVKTYQ
jgi:hypothetical protein